MSSILELRHVSFAVSGKRIVDKANWTLLRGQHWAILGPNGAGKTTLLRLACGYLWPNDGGTVLWGGEESVDLRELRRSIGWVSSTLAAQIPREEKSLETVVSGRFAQTGLLAMPWDPPQAADFDEGRVQLARLGCEHLATRPFGVLSQGEQQRVMIARALMARPLLIVLDEPCVGLDPGARESFLAALQILAAQPQGPSLVMVTHRLEEIMPAFKWLLGMRDGHIVCGGLKAEYPGALLMARLYDTVPEQLVYHNGRTWPIW